MTKSSTASSDASTTASSVTTAATATTGSLPPPKSADLGFLKVKALPPGPIVVKGYPHEVRTGMNDPAEQAGFSKDASVFGYCAHGGGIESTRCEFVERDGKVTKMNSTEGEGTPAEKAKKKAIDDYLKDKAIPQFKLDADPTKSKPPALNGIWTFTDITIDVARVGSAETKGGKETAAVVKIGGTVTGEPTPVYSITLGSPNAEKVPPHLAVMNVMSIAPGGSDIGLLAHFFGGEFSDAFAVKRMTIGGFASLVYNDTGMRHHTKSDFTRSAELFAKAVAADPNAKLPAYNLACALSRLKDPRAKDALAYAITKDATVKTRAQTDKDFDGVKSEAWFVEATK